MHSVGLQTLLEKKLLESSFKGGGTDHDTACHIIYHGFKMECELWMLPPPRQDKGPKTDIHRGLNITQRNISTETFRVHPINMFQFYLSVWRNCILDKRSPCCVFPQQANWLRFNKHTQGSQVHWGQVHSCHQGVCGVILKINLSLSESITEMWDRTWRQKPPKFSLIVSVWKDISTTILCTERLR